MSNAFIQALLMDDPDAGGAPIVIGPDQPAPNPDTGGTCLTDPYYYVEQDDTALDTGYVFGTNITFSNSNKTVDWPTFNLGACVATYVAHATGKYYFEIVRNSGSLFGTAVRDDYGCARAPRDFYGAYVADGIAYRRGGQVHINGSVVSSATALSNGDVVGYAIDFDAHKVWISLNGTWLTGDPSTNTSPISSSLATAYYYIGISGESGSAANMTIRARDADLQYPKPTGFVSWTSAPITAGASTSLSIHANSTFRDYSAAEKEVISYSPVALDASVKKFDSGSGNFVSTLSGLWVASSRVGFDATALTIEAQIYPTTIAGDTRCIVSVCEANTANLANLYIGVLADGSLTAFIRTVTGGSTTQISSSAGAVALNTWHHAELGIDGTNAYLFLDGVLVASSAAWTTYPTAKVAYAAIGRRSSQFTGVADLQFRGNIDEIHITKNICKHTTAFTPPAYAYCEFPSVTLGPPIPGTERLTGIGMTANPGTLGLASGHKKLLGQEATAGAGSVSLFSPNKTAALLGQALTASRGTLSRARYPNLIISASRHMIRVPWAGATITVRVFFNSDGTCTQQIDGGAVTAFREPYWAFPYDGRPNATTRAIPVSSVPHAFKQTTNRVPGDGGGNTTEIASNTTMAGGCVLTVIRRRDSDRTSIDVMFAPTTLNPRYGEVGYYGTIKLAVET